LARLFLFQTIHDLALVPWVKRMFADGATTG
jgi:hypothetical protein